MLLKAVVRSKVHKISLEGAELFKAVNDMVFEKTTLKKCPGRGKLYHYFYRLKTFEANVYSRLRKRFKAWKTNIYHSIGNVVLRCVEYCRRRSKWR